MECYNLITEQDELSNPVITKKKSDKFLVSIPHSGVLIPYSVFDNIKINDQVLRGPDLYTDKIFNLDEGIIQTLKLSSLIVNVNASKGLDGSTFEHLKAGPFRKASSNELEIIPSYSDSQQKSLIKVFDDYHKMLSDYISELKRVHGFALVLDGHSLRSVGPSDRPGAGQKRADFVVCTLDDTSAKKEIIDVFYNKLREEAGKHSLSVIKNHPYKGGFITKKHSSPFDDVHVIQLEISKKNYMDENNFSVNSKKVILLRGIISAVMRKTYNFTKSFYSH